MTLVVTNTPPPAPRFHRVRNGCYKTVIPDPRPNRPNQVMRYLITAALSGWSISIRECETDPLGQVRLQVTDRCYSLPAMRTKHDAVQAVLDHLEGLR